MKCKNDKRKNLRVWTITFGCNDCHYCLHDVGLDTLTTQELNRIKKDCDFYLNKHKKESVSC